jgi:uncharacterized membrane protein
MFDLLKDYALKRADLLKMEAAEKGVVTASTLTLIILLAIFGIFFLILFNIGIAVLVGSYINNYSYGFLIVAAFYLLVLIILLISGKSVKNMIANKLLQTFNNPQE